MSGMLEVCLGEDWFGLDFRCTRSEVKGSEACRGFPGGVSISSLSQRLLASCSNCLTASEDDFFPFEGDIFSEIEELWITGNQSWQWKPETYCY